MPHNYIHKEESKNMNIYVKKMTQIVLPLSLLYLLFSQYSSLFLQSYDYLLNFNFNLDLNNFKVFTYTTERNCIFLLCNGILVFIIQSSGLINKITPLDSSPKSSKVDDHRAADKDDVNAKLHEESKKEKAVEIILEEKSSENEVEAVDLQNFEVEKWVEDEDDDEDEGEGDDDGVIDTEELKKKCEEFIKKVKLEIQGA